MTNPDGGPAYPVSTSDTENGHQDGHHTWQHPGMSLRDHFAGLAMQSILSVLATGIRPCEMPKLAADAYFVADAMLVESTK